jgi:hypothetical protein
VPDGARRELHAKCSDALPARRARRRGIRPSGGIVLDLVYVAVIALTFVIVGLIAKGVEKL